MKKILNKGLVALAVVALGVPAFAATTTANFTASATVNASCVISASNIAFAAITPAASGTSSATGDLTVTCSNGSNYTMALDKGTGVDVENRSMGGTGNNGDKLKYNIYTTNAYNTVFGGSATLGGTGNGLAQTYTMYGQLALNQYIKSDTYTDSLTVTLTY